jgi:LmbE family N-acetylglucosaminyl deacetylase
MKNVMFISVHHDDETLGSGGTILKHIAEGDVVTCVFITSGNSFQSEMIEQLNSHYLFNKSISLNLPELKLKDLSLNFLIPKLTEVFTQNNPQILYIPNRSDIHSDHRAVFEAIMACTKTFRFPYIEQVLMCEVISETDFAPALIETAFIPNYFIDISFYFDKKIEILNIFKSELLPYPQTRNISSMGALNRYRGSQIGTEYAEAFMLLKQIVR